MESQTQTVPRSRAAEATMRAIVQDSYGSADVLRLDRVARPSIEADQVLVRVHAAGMDRGTWHLMAGLPYAIRLTPYRLGKNPVPGQDLAGTVVEIGARVSRFQVGDEVFGIGRGTFAEYAVTGQDLLVRKPAGLGFEQAAVVAISGLTALQALRDAGRVQAGQRVLIIGASGGVGTFAVQLAKAFGAEVTGVCSTAKVDLVRSIGADHVIDYLREDFGTGSRRYDLILDIGGNSPLARLRRVLTPSGTLVIVGSEDSGNWIGIRRQLRAVALSPLVRQRLTSVVSRQFGPDLERLAEFLETGVLTPVVDRTFPLDRVPDAMRLLASGGARGKLAITI